ncbi:MAG: DUF134 domain-containing protein [archaeon]
MARPRKIKQVDFEPDVTYFKPRAVPLNALEEVSLTIDELETLRLANVEKLNQTKAAEKMDIHQSTFQRTLTRAMEKVTDALVNGKAIKIHGGEYAMPRGDGQGSRRGRKGGDLAAGPDGLCVCPGCGHEQRHERGLPCNTIRCPTCATSMDRRD